METTMSADQRFIDAVAVIMREGSKIESVPVATYRIQLNRSFTFKHAESVTVYLRRLGISHIYTSPYLMAKSESLHGYDISDHNAINPEIGTEQEFNSFVERLRAGGMGQIIDVVPNHMGIAESRNIWWMDVLENGQASPYARYFDIDWNPVKRELRGKVLLPILGDQYGRVLERQELTLIFEGGRFFVTYYDRKVPICPKTYAHVLSYRGVELEAKMAEENQGALELGLLISALNHLPPPEDSDPEAIAQGLQEAELIKKRLAYLYSTNSFARIFIDENVHIFNGRKGDPHSFDLLDHLLNSQYYRLANWRVAADEINYRRFFDINELASINVERPEVFESTHRLILRLVQEGKVQGIRVDHPDGLYDPSEYFQRLQEHCLIEKAKAYLVSSGLDEESLTRVLKQTAKISLGGLPPSCAPCPLPIYVVAEKILSRGEKLSDAWPIQGTVGYEFMFLLNNLFVDTSQSKTFDQIYTDFIGEKLRFPDIVYERKKMIMNTTMASEINVLAYKLNRLSEKDRLSRDFTLYSLRDAIREIIACFPVYRTYIGPDGRVGDEDRRHILSAITRAKQRSPVVDISIFDYLRKVLLLQYPDYFSEEDRQDLLAFVLKFQQSTGPIMAKGMEDTAFYIYNRLTSLNEVGGDPQLFGILPTAFHERNKERQTHRPFSMLATTTHDTKRSEDVRARINVLSELPTEWQEHLVRWREMNRAKKAESEGRTVPDPNEEYFFYQTLLGVWPFAEIQGNQREDFLQRIEAYMIKASKEAKVNTSWISPNEEYDAAILAFVRKVLDPFDSSLFLSDFLSFQQRVAHFGIFNSLSQVLLKMFSPGVPDVYQGSEIWNFSLVDPDNRRPVDYSVRAALLGSFPENPSEAFIRDLLSQKQDGRIKLYLTERILNYRQAEKELVLLGEYLPLQEEGEFRGHLCAFARRRGQRVVIAAAPRLVVSLVGGREIDPIGSVWGETWLSLPEGLPGEQFRNVLTGERVEAFRREGRRGLMLGDVFKQFPVGLLEAE